ncbi:MULTISPECIES: hypothetical protein [Cyanophyceae]|nr:hypothetical protein [Nodosilinea sp. FACHB-131]
MAIALHTIRLTRLAYVLITLAIAITPHADGLRAAIEVVLKQAVS